MEAIILAGGFGTRLKSVVANVPKPMAPINGRPFLEILLNMLIAKGFTRVILSVGYLSNQIVAYFGFKFNGLPIEYEIEEIPLGTGGAIKRAMRRCLSDHVYIFNGDTFLDLEILAVEHRWNRNKKPIIVGREVSDSSRYGGLDVRKGCVMDFFEKGCFGSGLINAGCYVFPADLFEKCMLTPPFSIENDYLAAEVSEQCFDCFISNGKFIDIGIPEDYARAQAELSGLFI